MHVLHVYKDYPPVHGGIESHVRTLAEGLAARGNRVTVLVTASSSRTTRSSEGGVEVIRAGRLGTLRSTPLSARLFREMASVRPDVTHLHVPYPPGELAHVLLGRARATVVTYHSDVVRQRWLGRLYRPFLERFLDRAARILVTSPPYLESSTVLAPRSGTCTLVPLGIDPAPFLVPDTGLTARFRDRFGDRVVLFVGRLRSYKGLPFLVDAIERLDATLLLAGSGPMERAVRERARRGRAAGRVHLLGEVEEAALPALYAAADVVVLPSHQRSEAFGLVLLEAMAAAVPVVSTELGTGTSWVNEDGATGRVVPPGDPAALAAAIGALLDAPRTRRALGTAGRQRVLARFTAARMVESVAALYEEVLSEAPAS